MNTIKINAPSVRNMESANGNDVPNQFIIDGHDFQAFQSYSSIIVLKKGGNIYLDANKWDYSTTTGKYRNMYLGEDKRETERKIKLGAYILADLNSGEGDEPQTITRDQFMRFFRDTEGKGYDFTLANEDKIEVFMSALPGSSDLTRRLLEELCENYDTRLIDVLNDTKSAT